MWGFPKIGDPSIAHQIVGSLLQGPQNKVITAHFLKLPFVQLRRAGILRQPLRATCRSRLTLLAPNAELRG